MKTQAVIPAAGSGIRMNSEKPKPFIELKGKPLFVYCLLTLEECPSIDSVILVGEESRLDSLKKAVEDENLTKVAVFVAGGQRRCDSVANGLAALDDDCECVLIHDSARPLLSVDIVEAAVAESHLKRAVTVAVPVKPTIKRVDKSSLTVKETLNREELWEVQTPQVFARDLIVRAHAQNKDDGPTDDAALVERLGEPVRVVKGSYMNIKVTTPEDLKIAEMYLA